MISSLLVAGAVTVVEFISAQDPVRSIAHSELERPLCGIPTTAKYFYHFAVFQPLRGVRTTLWYVHRFAL